MEKRTVYHIVEWIIALAGCGFLAWKLATYEDYDSLSASLRAMDWPQWTALVFCLALMPVNMLIEAWKWQTLMNAEENRMSTAAVNLHLPFREAHRQVYYSKLAGLITPWRLGEYPARGMLMAKEDWSENKRMWYKVLSMGALGSATMTAAIIFAGLVAMLTVDNERLAVGEHYWTVVGIVLFVLIIALAFAPRLLRRWAGVSRRLVLITTAQSFVRLFCWCVQLILVLWALGAVCIQPSVFSLSFVYYLFVTITPNVPIAEAGVRGAWAIILFGTANAALAGVILWAINTLIPCLIWPIIRKNKK